MRTFASLFSGGGLADVGAIQAGYKPIFGVEYRVVVIPSKDNQTPYRLRNSFANAEYYDNCRTKVDTSRCFLFLGNRECVEGTRHRHSPLCVPDFRPRVGGAPRSTADRSCRKLRTHRPMPEKSFVLSSTCFGADNLRAFFAPAPWRARAGIGTRSTYGRMRASHLCGILLFLPSYCSWAFGTMVDFAQAWGLQ